MCVLLIVKEGSLAKRNKSNVDLTRKSIRLKQDARMRFVTCWIQSSIESLLCVDRVLDTTDKQHQFTRQPQQKVLFQLIYLSQFGKRNYLECFFFATMLVFSSHVWWDVMRTSLLSVQSRFLFISHLDSQRTFVLLLLL